MNQITDHEARALARLASEFRGIPEIEGLIKAKCRQTQDLENAIFGLLSAMGIDTAGGWLLGVYAKLVGFRPGSRPDTSLRNYVKAYVKLNKGSGTLPEILAIVRILVPGPTVILALEQKAAIILRLRSYAADSGLIADLIKILGKAHLGAVRIYLEWLTSADADAFTLGDSTGGTVTGLGLGDSTDPTVGGELAGAANS